MNLFNVSVSHQKVLLMKMKLSIYILCPKPSTLQVPCITVVCCSRVISGRAWVFTQVPCLVICTSIPWFIIQFVNFEACYVCGTVSVSWDNGSVAICWHVYQGCWSGQGFERGHSDSIKKTWQKCLQSWRIICDPFMGFSAVWKSSLRDPYVGHLAVKA